MTRTTDLTTRLGGLLISGVLLQCLASGCGTYQLRPPYDPSIQTVYVPIFRSFSFREDLNLELTRAVIQEIEDRSIYRVVNSPEEADTILSGQILFGNKFARLVNPNNLPRELLAEMTVEVTWEDVRPGSDPDVQPPVVRVVESVPFYPELGVTTDLAYQQSISKIATDIVNMMEERW